MQVLHVLSDKPEFDHEEQAYKIRCHIIEDIYFKDKEVAEKAILVSRGMAKSFTLDELTETRSRDYDG